MDVSKYGSIQQADGRLSLVVTDRNGAVHVKAELSLVQTGKHSFGSAWTARTLRWAGVEPGFYHGRILAVKPETVIGSCTIAEELRSQKLTNLSQSRVNSLFCKGLKFIGLDGFVNHPCYSHPDDRLLNRHKSFE